MREGCSWESKQRYDWCRWSWREIITGAAAWRGMARRARRSLNVNAKRDREGERENEVGGERSKKKKVYASGCYRPITDRPTSWCINLLLIQTARKGRTAPSGWVKSGSDMWFFAHILTRTCVWMRACLPHILPHYYSLFFSQQITWLCELATDSLTNYTYQGMGCALVPPSGGTVGEDCCMRSKNTST